VRLVSKLLPFPAPDGSEEPSRGNQGHFVPEGEGFTWRGLRFRTQSEVVIAQELEAAKLVFWPLCACRITGVRGKRETRELDFLVIHGGVAAILELDGGPHNGRAADDHRRDRLFEYHAGIWVIERVPSQYALHHPREVVRTFLKLIEKYRASA
jgi:very-short-patch-repair endonuclease